MDYLQVSTLTPRILGHLHLQLVLSFLLDDKEDHEITA
jgi:hypothetical protein